LRKRIPPLIRAALHALLSPSHLCETDSFLYI